MEIIQLQCFVTLAKTLNFRKAAEEIYISQPTLSRYIARLEAELKVSLFDRGKNFSFTRLTPAGRYFLPKAEELLQTVQTTMNQLAHFSKEDADNKSVRIGIDLRLIKSTLPTLIYDYSKTKPSPLSIQTIKETKLPEMLDQGDLDVGIAIHIDKKYLTKISCQVLGKYPLFIYAHHDLLSRYPEKELKEILKNEKIATTSIDQKINAHIMSILYEMGIQSTFTFCESPYQIDFLVNTSKAVAILPDTANPANPMICRIPIPDNYGSLIIYGLYPFETPETTLVMDYLKEALNQ